MHDQSESTAYVGGLCNTSASVQMSPSELHTGRECGQLLGRELTEKPEYVELTHQVVEQSTELVHKECVQGQCEKRKSDQATTEMRNVMVDFLQTTP